ncbi:MAG: hypothetical protein FWF15_03215 [Oscillospiraceae bacterium]|nr:hypothetical protein [Oscillospiraceae bacterium]
MYVKEFIKDGMTDSEAINACLKQWKSGEIIFDGKDWLIDEAIIIRSGMTVIIDGCSVIQRDEMFDNVFRGDNLIVDPNAPYGFPLRVDSIQNVKILGKNGAMIIGPEKNKRGWHPVLNQEQDMTGDFWGWRTFQICLSRCDGLEVGGFAMTRTRCWAISFDMCSNGYVHDIDFDTYVKNGDGVNLRVGCHHFKIENITGVTSDDTVACTALKPHVKYPFRNYLYTLVPAAAITPDDTDLRLFDIHDVEISHIFAGHRKGCGCHPSLLTADGIQMYDINIQDIGELEGETPPPYGCVNIYTSLTYGEGYSPGDFYNIKVDGVTAKISPSAVRVKAKVKDVVLKNIVQENTNGVLFDIEDYDGIMIL